MDNIGENVGHIVGMGSNIFGSYIESSCVPLVDSSISSFGNCHYFTTMCYPLLISLMGIIAFLITTWFATNIFEIKSMKQIDPQLKKKLDVSNIDDYWHCYCNLVAFPSSFTTFNFGPQKVVRNWYVIQLSVNITCYCYS